MKTTRTHSRYLDFIPAALSVALTIILSLPGNANADAGGGNTTAPLKPDVPYLFVVHQGRSIKVQRNVNKSFIAGIDIRGTLIQTSSSCPPFCLQPQQLDVPVETIAESEIVDFMLTTMRDNQGVLIDARSKTSFNNSTIPGSLNYDNRFINKGLGNAEFDSMLKILGAKRRETPNWITRQLENFGVVDTSLLTDKWDFTDAKDLIVWATSATDSSSAIAIKGLMSAGYPAEKLKWYRGGMAAWQYWGFTTVRALKRN